MNQDSNPRNASFNRGFDGSVRHAYGNQIDYCRNNGATITARIVKAVMDQLDDPDAGPFIAKIRSWVGRPLADGLPLRSAGALHGLYQAGLAPELAPIYADQPADDGLLVGNAVRVHAQTLLPWLDGPPQTNEAGRSSSFVAALLWLANQGLPPHFECLEIGSSAGINLMMDRYRYELGGVTVGPEDPAMTFAPEWRGAPPPSETIAFESLKGCDVAPLDLTDPQDALRLKSYIWPEHTVRFERLEAAVAEAQRKAPNLVQARAADFLEQSLAMPQREGTTRVLMHSIVMQYLPEEEQNRVYELMEHYGAQATKSRALAWVALEGNRSLLNHGLEVRYWPAGEQPRLIATAHAHGAWIDWRG